MRDKFGFMSFLEQFPDEDACLRKLFNIRYSNLECCTRCGVIGAKFYRVRKRKSFACGECGYQIYPLAGTILHGSTTSVHLWFYAIYLFATCKNGISAKELERVLEVTYKTAWKMGHKIRELMDFKGERPLHGTVEIDEALFGGVTKGKRGWAADNKTTLFGMIERGYRARIFCVPNRTHRSILPVLIENIAIGSTINSDEWKGYKNLDKFGFEHKHVNHSKYQWRKGNVYTNSVEGHWSNLKKSIRGTHTFASQKHLQKYLNEHSFRYSHRKSISIFDELLAKI